MSRAVHVEHRKRADLDADGIDDQHVAFVMADRIPVPGRRDHRGMRLVHADMAHFMIVRIEDLDLVLVLHDLHSDIPEHERHAAGPTLVARRRVGHSCEREVSVPLYDARRFRLQDRIASTLSSLVAAP